MSNSKFKLTGENTNLARVAQMILGPCTNVLRDVLGKEIHPADLEKKVRGYIVNTKKPQINKQQEALVYGQDYSKFDVTLMYFLLRNMCSIQPHSNKWGNNPHPGDRSVSANIERIRLIRNEYGHNSETSMSDTDFNNKYQGIIDIVQELENYLGSSTEYQDEVKELETCSMDPTQSEKNIKELLDLHEKIKDIAADVKEMKNTVVPRNIKAMYEIDISKWKVDDTFFVETHSFWAMLDTIKKQSYVTFVGVPGSGKTFTARHIALTLQEEEGYEILPIKDIKDIETFCDPHYPQVFIVDDVVEKDFDNEDRHFNEKKREVLKMCKVSTTPHCFEFTSALNEMEGTFTQKCADKFTFVHDSMFEIVAHHFGSQFPQLILQHLSSAYIANYIKLDDRNRKRRRESESQVQETDNDIANSNTIVGEDGIIVKNRTNQTENSETLDLTYRTIVTRRDRHILISFNVCESKNERTVLRKKLK
uniref:DZIP3-like HEPN domain-containing protein n=1 Tax=Magallana gigas TaxID=29159 RepID=A0A8W8NXM6_MAGGI